MRKGGRDFITQPPITGNAQTGKEAGNPPIKIRLKRVSYGFEGNPPIKGRTETQVENRDSHTIPSDLSQSITQEPNPGGTGGEREVPFTQPVNQLTQPHVQL